MSRSFRFRGKHAALCTVVSAAIGGILPSSAPAQAVDSASIVSGTLVQGTVKSSLGAGTSYDQDTNNMGDWPLNTGGTASDTYAISYENPDFNGNAYGGNANTMIAFGNGGSVELQFATPITPIAGEKDLGIFTTQAITGGNYTLQGNMEAQVLVSQNGTTWYTLSGQQVANPTSYTASPSQLNAPTMAYNYGTGKIAWQYGEGTSAANLAALTIADYTTPMPNDYIFNGNDPTGAADRSALTTDSSAADYAAVFGDSGGGNWFDVSGSGLSQIDYVYLIGDANDPSTGGVRLDAVFANANSVPEPADIAMFVIGGLGLLRRRRRA